MPTFISTITFTEQGMKAIAETTKRATRIKAEAKKMNVKIKDVYWTFGLFDGLLVFEAPDDETATAMLLNVGAQGNVKTSTARAFTASERDQLMGTRE